MSYVTINQHHLYYHVKGHGQDVLMVHGWAGSWRPWARCMHHLSQAGFRTWALDLPGHGCSSKPPITWYSIPRFAATLANFIQAMNLQRPVLIGHSMGGAVTLELCRLNPDLARALVLSSPAVSGRLSPWLESALQTPPGRWLTSDAPHHTAWINWLGPRHVPGCPWLVPGLALRRRYEDLTRSTFDAVLGGLYAVRQFDFSAELPHIRVPTLVLLGLRDKLLPIGDGELAARDIPNAQLVRLPNSGHEIATEQPKQFEQSVLTFLKDRL